MTKGKRQQFKEGAILRIGLSENRFVFARLLPGNRIGIYDNIVENDEDYSIDQIIKYNIFLYVSLYRTVVTKGIFEIISFRALTIKDIEKIPPQFMQDASDIADCLIFYADGKERKADPLECVELERSAVWDEKSLTERIEDKYASKKNIHRELQKVILSKDDVRYLNPKLRWDFKEEKFY
jgi:hypothetical protein